MRFRLVAWLIAAGLPACFVDDTPDLICHERGRTPAVLVGDQPVDVTLALTCDRTLTLTAWTWSASPATIGAPSGGAGLTADRPSGRDFTLTGAITPASHLRLDEIRVLATDEVGTRDTVTVVDWVSPP